MQTLPPIHVWQDNETEIDLLGFDVHANLIRSVITDPKVLPVTVGVFGDWGGAFSVVDLCIRHNSTRGKTMESTYARMSLRLSPETSARMTCGR